MIFSSAAVLLVDGVSAKVTDIKLKQCAYLSLKQLNNDTARIIQKKAVHVTVTTRGL